VEEIAAENAPKLNLPPAAVKTYLTENINYSLDEEKPRGAEVVFQAGARTGIIPVERELRFV